MGVLNLTPDSFSDGGRHHRNQALDIDLALDAASKMVASGAAIIDVGGESSRPGADPVSLAEELGRVMPVLERLLELDTIVSVDTYKPAVAEQALARGVHLINDITGGRSPGMVAAVAKSDAALCLMHMQGEPQTMQQNPQYGDVCAEVGGYLSRQVADAQQRGIPSNRLVVDPGFGFGKTLEQNLLLLQGMEQLAALVAQPAASEVTQAIPVLVGLSRKSMLAAITQRQVDERLAGSVALATLAAYQGAKIIRAHDVAATVDAINVAQALREVGSQSES